MRLPKITKTKVFIALFLIGIVLLFVLPPIVYGYDYPTNGDDSFRHIRQMEKIDTYYQNNIDRCSEAGLIEVGSRYGGLGLTWMMWKPIEGFGIGLTDFFVLFNWISLAVIALCLFYFGQRLWGWQAGMAIVMLAMFSAKAMSYYFYNGTIFNIVNMYVFVLMGVLSFMLWQKSGRKYFMVVSLLLFCIAGIYHSSSGMIMIAVMLMYLGLSVIYRFWKKDLRQVMVMAGYALAFALVVILPSMILNPEAGALADRLAMVSSSVSGYSPDNPVSFMTWAFDACTPWILPLMVLFGYMLWQRKAKIDWKPFALLGCFIIVLAIGAFTPMWYDHPRFALELGIIVAIAGGALAGLAIKARGNKIFSIAVAVVILGSGLPTIYQFAHYSVTYNPADKACVEMLNSLEGESWNCSSQIHPELYGLYVTDKIYNSGSADYTIWRNEPITPESDPDNYSWTFNEYFMENSSQEDYQGTVEIGNWSFGEVTVVLYRE